MSSQLACLEQTFKELKARGVSDTRFYIGEVAEATPEQFAAEANVVMEAYVSGKVKEVNWGCSSIN